MSRRVRYQKSDFAARCYLKRSPVAATRQPVLKPVITRALFVTDDDGVFRALWKKIFGVWSCTEADPRLRWMVGKTQSEVHLLLVKMGVNFDWDRPAVRPFVHPVVSPHHDSSWSNPTHGVSGTAALTAPSPVPSVGQHDQK